VDLVQYSKTSPARWPIPSREFVAPPWPRPSYIVLAVSLFSLGPAHRHRRGPSISAGAGGTFLFMYIFDVACHKTFPGRTHLALGLLVDDAIIPWKRWHQMEQGWDRVRRRQLRTSSCHRPCPCSPAPR